MLCSSANCLAIRLLWSRAHKPERAVYNNKRGVFLVLILRRFQALISRLELKVPGSPCKVKIRTLFLNPNLNNPSNQSISMVLHQARVKTESSTLTGSASLTALWLPMISTSALRPSYRKGLSQMETKLQLASWFPPRLRPFRQSKWIQYHLTNAMSKCRASQSKHPSLNSVFCTIWRNRTAQYAVGLTQISRTRAIHRKLITR